MGGRRFAIAAAVAMIAACATVVACGRDLPAPEATDAGVDRDAEPRIETFSCGPSECRVGLHACCFVDGGVACALIADGCPGSSGDAGAEAGPSLLCTTYRNCPNPDDECCWSKENGAVCSSRCADGESSLCHPGEDRCDWDQRCEAMSDPPLPNVGQCRYDGTGSSGGGGGGPPGGGGNW